jgi:hypothetical protein
MSMRAIRREWLARAYHEYVDKWLWNEWGYARGWGKHLPEMVLWYAVAGSAGGGNTMADTLVERARTGVPIPPHRRPTWRDAQILTKEICAEHLSNPVDWLTGGCGQVVDAWHQLDEVFGIGCKIASFLMRDLSFLRDYSAGQGYREVTYRRRIARAWFDHMPYEDQALFVPIDVYVHKSARRHGASKLTRRYSAAVIQAEPDLHRRVATEIVGWARRRGYDPRDLDQYWYSLEAEDIHEDGRPTE